jgi:tRNA A-37 threonylcarbamoyl transferase component Bud32
MEAKELESVENGAGLLLASVSHSILNAEFSVVVEALAALHANGICHGDARIANAVWAAEKVKWIDFRGARFPPITTPALYKNDMTIVVVCCFYGVIPFCCK